MHARIVFSTAALAVALATTAHADLLGDLKAKAGDYAMPAIGSSTVGNAAGVLQYCVKNNYIGGDAASIKNKLMAKVTGQPEQQSGYAEGAKGVLTGGDGKSLNLKAISGKLKTKACDYVLQNAKSLV